MSEFDLTWLENEPIKPPDKQAIKRAVKQADKMPKQKQKKRPSSRTVKQPMISSGELQDLIEQKIKEILPRALLNLVSLGLKHELSLENMKQYFREVRQAKLYNLIRYFSDAKPKDVEEMLDYLHETNFLIKTRNRWFRINPKVR